MLFVRFLNRLLEVLFAASLIATSGGGSLVKTRHAFLNSSQVASMVKFAPSLWLRGWISLKNGATTGTRQLSLFLQWTLLDSTSCLLLSSVRRRTLSSFPLNLENKPYSETEKLVVGPIQSKFCNLQRKTNQLPSIVACKLGHT